MKKKQYVKIDATPLLPDAVATYTNNDIDATPHCCQILILVQMTTLMPIHRYQSIININLHNQITGYKILTKNVLNLVFHIQTRKNENAMSEKLLALVNQNVVIIATKCLLLIVDKEYTNSFGNCPTHLRFYLKLVTKYS